jgi:hypothetical protein
MRPRIGDNVDSSQSFEHSFGASSRNVLRSQTHLCCFKRLACSEVFCDNRHSSGFAMSSMRADRPSSQGERDRCSGTRAAATIRLDQFDRCDRRGISATELSHRLASPAPFAEPSRGYRYHLEGVFFNLGVAFAVIALGLRVMGRRQDWIIIALIVAGAFYILSWILKKRWQSIGEPRYQQELQSRRNAWKEAYAEWDSLYYCGRCDRPFPVVLT